MISQNQNIRRNRMRFRRIFWFCFLLFLHPKDLRPWLVDVVHSVLIRKIIVIIIMLICNTLLINDYIYE